MIGALITLVGYLFVIGLLLWLVFYVLSEFPLPHPFPKIIRIGAVVIAVLIVIVLILDILGGGTIGVPRFR